MTIKPSSILRFLLRPVFRLVIAAAIAFGSLFMLVALKPDTVEAASGGTDAAVRTAVAKLPAFVRKVMKRTGVPGVAVAVVHKDKLIYAEGFGVRSTRTGGAVTRDTVFQIASVSKPLGSTAVAAAISNGALTWDTPVAPLLPGFSLADPSVSEAVTVGDLYAHRSGLPGEFGNDLEKFGFDRQYIFEHADREPLAPFRTFYAYSNFGLTAGGVAAANATGRDWNALARDFLFAPLGMVRSTYSHEALKKMKNVASLHQRVNGRWVPGPKRNADAQAPAGGANSTVMDLSRWIRLLLAGGVYEGRRIIERQPLDDMLSIQIRTSGDGEGIARGYGFGMEVSVEADGGVAWSHSGDFQRGASTQVYLVPELELGIVTLTNGWPVGVPQAINATFVDWVSYGRSTEDWLKVIGALFAPYTTPTYEIDGQKRPRDPNSSGLLVGYAGSYESDYAGNAEVTVQRRQLVLALGPDGATRIPLRHWDGDVFFYNALGLPDGFYTAVRFLRDGQGFVTSMTVDEVNSGLGRFARIP
ncbi:MAG: D-alanyl-D-alanine-carboxypeptidase/endopeptidase AmpH [Pseudomonadota bacterium]|jgi:CubicO group peptidase (beta-lactamase class C family)